MSVYSLQQSAWTKWQKLCTAHNCLSNQQQHQPEPTYHLIWYLLYCRLVSNMCPVFSPLQIAPSKEVLIGVSNINPLREGMLDTFLSGVKQAGVSNYVVVALDTETAADLTARGFNAFYMPISVSTGLKLGSVWDCKSMRGMLGVWC